MADPVRPRGRRLIAGVRAGLANRCSVSAWLVRGLLVLSLLLPGPQVLLCAASWVVMPTERP